MKVKELFRNIRAARKELWILGQKESDLTLSMLPGAIQYDKDKVDSSPDDPMLKYAERLSEIEEIKKQRMKQLIRSDHIAQLILQNMPTAQNRLLLELRYIEGGISHRYSWYEVAEELGYAEKYTRDHLHRMALNEAQQVYDQFEKDMAFLDI